MAKQAVFLEGNLLRHITVMSLTASVGLMAVFIVDFVDMIFISMLGKSQLAAAVGYAGAILFFTSSFGIGVAIAAGALVARAIGAGKVEDARRLATHALIYGVAFAVVFAWLVWMNLTPLAALMGASGETLRLTVHYLAIIVPSLPFLLVGMVGGAILRAHGDARRAMMATVWGGVVNAVLDPILIFGLDLEMTGAAMASVAARVVMAAAAVVPIYRYYNGFTRPSVATLHVDFRPIAAIAVPAILTQLATPIGQAYVTRSMAAVWRSGRCGHGYCRAHHACRIWRDFRFVGGNWPDHRAEPWRGTTRPGSWGISRRDHLYGGGGGSGFGDPVSFAPLDCRPVCADRRCANDCVFVRGPIVVVVLFQRCDLCIECRV